VARICTTRILYVGSWFIEGLGGIRQPRQLQNICDRTLDQSATGTAVRRAHYDHPMVESPELETRERLANILSDGSPNTEHCPGACVASNPVSIEEGGNL